VLARIGKLGVEFIFEILSKFVIVVPPKMGLICQKLSLKAKIPEKTKDSSGGGRL
jgi:hypothetical protein